MQNEKEDSSSQPSATLNAQYCTYILPKISVSRVNITNISPISPPLVI